MHAQNFSAEPSSINRPLTMNPDTDTTLDNQLSSVRYIIQLLLIPTVVSMGVPLNIINVIVLIRMHTATTHFMATLAVYDLLYLLMSLLISPRAKVSTIHLLLMQQEWFVEMLTWIIPSSISVSNAATWLVCAFAFERYVWSFFI